jgi:uncharacterized protein YkwD
MLSAMLSARRLRAEEASEKRTAAPIPLNWAAESVSPRPATATATDAPLHAHCGQRDLGLSQVASAIVDRRIAEEPRMSQRAIKRVARSAGVPYPFVAAWSLEGSESEPLLDADHTVERVAAWVRRRPVRGARRCGIARGMTSAGLEVMAVVIADAIAELTAFPTHTKVAKWLALQARVHPDATSANVVLLGPRGRPKRVLASFGSGDLKSRFTLDQPGRWIVQVVVGMETGPQPVLELEVFAGEDPPDELVDAEASTVKHNAKDLLLWLNDARQKEGLAAVERSTKLDALARAHAIKMVRANHVAHDVGDGTPEARVAAGGIGARRVGENVARAATVRRIHEALWDSPSHRENTLDPSFRYVGIAAVRDERGRVWSVELFADQMPKRR